MNSNIISMADIAHSLWGDEYELPTDRLPSSLYNHPHADIAIDAVHEHITTKSQRSLYNRREYNVQLVQATNWRAHSLPQRQ
jgi:hypothetical protein